MHLPASPIRAARPRLLAGGLVGVAAAVLVVVRDPHTPGSFAVCPSALLGFDCPGCGTLRATHDLLTGQVVESMSHNVLTIPALGWLGWWWLARVTGLPGPPQSSRAAYVLLVVIGVFTVLRNLPGSPLAS